MNITPLLLSLFVVAGLAAPSRADVLVVDAAGGGNFTQLPPAIAAAHDGDVILVRAGTYNAWTGQPVPAKSLAIVADSPTQPVLTDLILEDQPAGVTLIVRGFTLTTDFGDGVNADNCAGALVIEDCDLVGGLYVVQYPTWAGARLTGCASVSFARCTLKGSKGLNESIGGSTSSWGPGAGGPGADATNSHVAFHACTLLAGAGGYGGTYAWGSDGGSGLALHGSTALLSGSLAQGGPGGNGCLADDLPEDCNGGPGLYLDATSVLQVLEGNWIGGVAGVGKFGEPGLPGLPYVGPAGQPVLFSGTARALVVDSPLREQQPGTLLLDGEPGDFVLLFTAFDASSLPLPGKKGWLALAPPLLGPFALGVIADPSGQELLGFTAPDLVPATLQGQTFLLQGAFLAAGGGAVLSAPTSFTLVDETL